MITFKKITEENFDTCMKLKPGEGNEKFVAPNMVSLAQAYVAVQENECIPMPFAIYSDEELVGFIQLAHVTKEQDEDLEEDIYEVWRFMIDENHQGKGLGQLALAKAIEYIKTFPHGKADKLLLSYVPGNDAGQHVYAKLGFVETGDMEDGEIVMAYDLKN